MALADYEKVVRGNKTSVLRSDLSKPLDEFCEIHKQLVVDLLDKTPRISKTRLHQALLLLERQNSSDALSFAGKVVDIVSAARAIGKSFASGKKTSPAMAAVVKALLQWSRSPAHRTPSRSPRDEAPSTPVSNSSAVPKKRLHTKTSPVQCKRLFHEVSDSPPVRKLSRNEIMAQLGLATSSASSAVAAAHSPVVLSSSESQPSSPVRAPSKGKKAEPPAGAKSFWTNSAVPCLVRSINGNLEEGAMQAGPNGFAIAIFKNPDETKETDIPNLNLVKPASPAATVLKKPAACKSGGKKRPASAIAEAPEVPGSSEGSGCGENMAPPAPAVTMTYNIFPYKTGAWAIREAKLGKRQLFQIINRQKTAEQLKSILESAKQKLLDGHALQEVKEWAQKEARS